VQQTIIYVKCCAHWFVCLGIFLFIAFVLFLLVVFIHLFCVRLPYGGEIKLYTISETKIAFRYKIIFQVSDISSVERRFVVVTFLPSFFADFTSTTSCSCCIYEMLRVLTRALPKLSPLPCVWRSLLLAYLPGAVADLTNC